MGDLSRLRDEFETVEPPKMATSQQEVASQAFESAVSPLRACFDERLEGTVEGLAQKGIAFGGVGGQGLRDVFKEQQRIEGAISSRLGAELGQSALDQAFSASEAAKTRSLQKELQTSGFDFATETQQRAQDFTASESEKGRASQSALQEAGFVQQDHILRLGQEFQGDQNKALQAFQAEQNLLGRALTASESQKSRDFKTALTELGIEANKDAAAIDRQDRLNQQVLDLALSGNIKQEDVTGILTQMLGEGTALTTDDEAALQTIAAASGLTVEEYTEIRSKIGTAQVAEILGTHFEDSLGNIVDEGNEGAIETPNINFFIEDPIAARKFQQNLSKAAEESQLNIARINAGLVEPERITIRQGGGQGTDANITTDPAGGPIIR